MAVEDFVVLTFTSRIKALSGTDALPYTFSTSFPVRVLAVFSSTTFYFLGIGAAISPSSLLETK